MPTIVTRAGKGSPLTNTELDANFNNLNAAINSESLVSLSQSIHSGTVVKAFFYDTSKDSDGGAWRKRCQDKSWYNETLNGAWLGQAATATAAWALSGAVTGAYFQNTTDGKFYALGASSPNVAEVFRGNRAEFPEQAAIIAESGRVVIYDMTQANCPMWRVIATSAAGYPFSSIFAINGIICVGRANASGDLLYQNYISAVSGRWSSTGKTEGAIATDPSALSVPASGTGIVNRYINDVAMTVLPDAPIDLATGLPIPTIAVATAGGVSVIHNSGTVVNSSSTSAFNRVSIGPDYTLYGGMGSTAVSVRYFYNIGTAGSSFVLASLANNTVPPIWSSAAVETATTATKRALLAHGKSNGLGLWFDNPASNAKGMVAYITNAYNTGWQVGDIRGAWLADTTAETITGSGELVTNGTFATDVSSWTGGALSAGAAATLSFSSGKMRITNNGATYGVGYQALTTVVGRVYYISVDVTRLSSGSSSLYVGTSIYSSNLGSTSTTAAGTTTMTLMFTATSTTTYISLVNENYSGAYHEYDNVTCKLADPDRSTKNTGLIVNGSITKSAVATGAQLMAYSGFDATTATNYLYQPSSTNNELTTGLLFLGWVSRHTSGGNYGIAGKGSTAAYSWSLRELSTGSLGLDVVLTTGGTKSLTVANFFNGASTQSLVSASFDGTTIQITVDGSVAASLTVATDTIKACTENLYVGASWIQSVPVFRGAYTTAKLALVRMSATVPSADQIAYIYNTEKMLFQSNTKCVIDGTSTSVTALAYDDLEDALHVGTSWGRSKFRDLVRVESAATSVGAITSLSAGQGSHITGGASAARYYQPAMYLREELRRKEEARKALGQIVTPLWATGDGTATTFNVPKGFYPKFVYKQGLIMRDGSSNDYTISFDGFIYTVTFTAAPLNGHNICFMGVRNV